MVEVIKQERTSEKLTCSYRRTRSEKCRVEQAEHLLGFQD